MRRRMYRELGGFIGYMATPVRELQEVRLSIIAEMNEQAEQEAEMKRKQKEYEDEQRRRQSRMR